MMTDAHRLAYRPTLELLPAAAPAEKFQNETLRPLAKLQHEHIMAVFRMFLLKRKVKLGHLNQEQRFAKVKELVTRDNRLRGLLFGLVIGHFTQDELTYYGEEESTVNRRITNLLTERISKAMMD